MGNAYSFKDVSASLVGPPGVSINLGYGAANADEGISLDAIGDKNTMLIGADGSGMNSLAASRAGTVTVRLLKTSPINALLHDLFDAQIASSTLWGQNVITVQETQSGDITVATQCAFKKKPNLNYRKDGDIIEWLFDSVHLDTVLGTY